MIWNTPCELLPSYREEITFGDTPYILIFNWNTRGQFWSLDILDREENDILTGIKLVNQWEFLGMFADERLPKGKLYVVDIKGKMDDIVYDSFINGQCVLIFEDN